MKISERIKQRQVAAARQREQRVADNVEAAKRSMEAHWDAFLAVERAMRNGADIPVAVAAVAMAAGKLAISRRYVLDEAKGVWVNTAKQEAHKEPENLWDGTYQWGSYGRPGYDAAMNAYRPVITPEDLATVRAKPSVWQRIKGWLV